MSAQKKEVVNVIKMKSPLIEGQEYFYLRPNGEIAEGTYYKCEACGKACTTNSVGILSFNQPVITIEVADITDDELYYCEETDRSVCTQCCK